MAECLSRMDRCLVLSRTPPEPDATGRETAATWCWSTTVAPGVSAAPGTSTAAVDPLLREVELGEFVLQLHSYLLLLDFASPPFSSRAADAIHRDAQLLLRQGQLSVNQQSALLDAIIERHRALKRFL